MFERGFCGPEEWNLRVIRFGPANCTGEHRSLNIGSKRIRIPLACFDDELLFSSEVRAGISRRTVACPSQVTFILSLEVPASSPQVGLATGNSVAMSSGTFGIRLDHWKTI